MKDKFCWSYLLCGLLLLCSPFIAAAVWFPLNGAQAQAEAPQITVQRSDYSAIQLSVQLSGFSHEIVDLQGQRFCRLDLADEGYTAEIGRPQLPVIRKLLEIPYGARAEVVVNSTQRQEISLAELGLADRLLPVQPYAPKRPGGGESLPFALEEASYQKSGFAETPTARIAEEGYLRGHHFLLLEISPFDYSPANGRLRICSQIQLQINLTAADAGRTHAAKARLEDRQTHALARRLFVNAGAFDESDLIPPPLGLLVITSPDFASLPLLQDFIAWKEQKGFHTTLTTTAEIGTTTAQIKSYIQNAYDSWAIPPNFVLLIGDTDVIPYWLGHAPDNPGTDLYYTTLEGHDCIPDVGLGRLSVENDADLTNILNKILNYEQALWSGDAWEKAAVFMASNDQWWITEATHDTVITNYLDPEGYASTRLYCRTYGATPPEVSAALNEGRSLAMYAGHGYFFCWQDGPPFLQRDVEALTNDYYPFVGSFACDTGQFMRGAECFGETWLRCPHGAIAFWGASATSYWIPDDVLERALFSGFFDEQAAQEDENLTWIAGMTNYAKFSHWRQCGSQIIGLYYWELYNVLGDPTLDVWTDVPQNLTVVMPDTVLVGQTSLTIGVSGYPDWAMVNAYSDAEDLQVTGYVTDGAITFHLGTGFTVPGTLHVWITGHDCRPYHGTATLVGAEDLGLGAGGRSALNSGAQDIVPQQPEAFSVANFPNPFNATTTIRFELPVAGYVKIEVFNVSGRVVGARRAVPLQSGSLATPTTGLIDGWREAGVHEFTYDGSPLPSGVYICRLQAGEFAASQKIILLK